MRKYLLINSKTLLAKQFIKTIQPQSHSIWELNFVEGSRIKPDNISTQCFSVCDPKDDWSLNYELERAFSEFGYFDEVIFFPGDLAFGAIEAIPSWIIDEQVTRQITAVIAIYRILADKLSSQRPCQVTQFLHEESCEFGALSSMPLAINGAMRGFVDGLRREFQEIDVDIEYKSTKPVYKDFINEEYSFLNDLNLVQYQQLVNSHLKKVDKFFDSRKV